MSTQITEGSYTTPRVENARVSDAMRHGILSAPADSSLREAARTMALHHVHMVVVTDTTDGSPIGVLSDETLLTALLDGRAECALEDVVRNGLSTVPSDERLLVAARLMRERGTAHLLVRDTHSGRPVGMLSTLDIAGTLAWGEA